jgi:metal-dependent amidase/aminoacylase/carboxypeptidase family protein
MSQVTILKIKITGTGGHGAEPERCKVAVWKAVDFYQQFQDFLKELKQNTGKDFACTLPIFQAG